MVILANDDLTTTAPDGNDGASSALDPSVVMDYLTQGVRLISRDSSIVRINRAFSELSGVPPQEAKGRKCFQIFKSEFCHTPQCRLARILAGEDIIQTEIERRKPDGTVIPCMVTAFALKGQDGRVLGIMESFRDITRRRELLTRVKETEDRYRALIELDTEAGEAVLMLQDVDGKEAIQTYVSEQWPRITGYSKEELLGMSFLQLLKPELRAESLARHRKKMSGEPVPGLFEITIINKKGEEIPVELTGASTHYQGRRANVAYIRDISYRKHVESELARYQASLEGLVNERTSQLLKEVEKGQEMETKLQAICASLEKQINDRVYFTRAIVHELKTPLTAIIASSEPLTQGTSEYRSRLARNIHRSALTLNSRIDELLDLAKGEIGMLNIHKSDTCLDELMDDFVKQLTPQAKKSQQDFVIDIASPLPRVMADSGRLQQALSNLVNNAIKFNPRPGTITIKVRQQKGQIRFEVRDEGPGIPREDQEVIFQAYHRLSGENENLSGLGLGLALTKMLVELHGGRMFLRSEPGKGSTFGFSLPVRQTGDEAR